MNRVTCLDGMRGVAALWVLVGHCMLLTGFLLKPLSVPDLGVDLFILLSGFLMVLQYQIRADFEDWRSPRTWIAFWTRRFFRLSPLYYCALVVALVAGPAIYADRVLIDHFLGNAPQLPERYVDGSFRNFALHVTYLFGLIPAYSFRTALPDWSLGLEMQFYAVFPFFILTARRLSWLAASVCFAVVMGAIAVIIAKAGIVYPMPSFLPLKMNVFLAGMLIAAALKHPRKGLFFGMVALLAALPIPGQYDHLHLIVRELLAIGFWALVHLRSVSLVDAVARLFSSKPAFWLGELSYSVYLIHLLFLHPVAAWAIGRFGAQISPPERFLIVVTLVAAASYGLAFLTYYGIERPGQQMGRTLLKSFTSRRFAGETQPESIAAP